MQFIERNPVVLGVIALAMLVAVSVAALTVQRADFAGSYSVIVEFSDANGLRLDDPVTVAGANIGRVSTLEIVEDRVEVTLLIEGVDLPAQTAALITPRTLVGKRAVELETGDDFAQLLADGDRIPLAQTTVYTDVPQFGNASDELLSEVDAEALNRFLQALTELTEGQRDEVALLIEGGTRLTDVVNTQEQPIRELLRQLRSLSITLNSRDDELISIIDDFEVVLGRLAARREDIRRLFSETREAAATGADLVATIRPDLDAVLDEVHRDIAILDRHQMDLAESLAYLPDSIGGFASIAFSGDVKVPYGHVLVQSLGPAGVDQIAGCGGLIDQQLDQLLGPDPRSCEQQDNDSFPDDQEEPDTNPIPDLPIDPPPAPAAASGRLPVDVVARRLVPQAVPE